jgi:calmodulin
MADTFTDEQFIEFKELWTNHAGSVDLTVNMDQLFAMMKGLGCHDTIEELKVLATGKDSKGNPSLDFPGFLVILTNRMRHYDGPIDNFDYLKEYDEYDTGFMSPADFKKAFGADFDGKEIDAIMLRQDLYNKDGNINYKQFISEEMNK